MPETPGLRHQARPRSRRSAWAARQTSESCTAFLKATSSSMRVGAGLRRRLAGSSRLRFTPGSPEVVYARKNGHDEPEQAEVERIDAMDFVARVLVQIPDPRRHLARYYGFHSNAARRKRKKAAAPAEPSCPSEAPEGATTTPDGVDRAALRRRWAEMIRRVYEVDPLVCPRCGGEMRVLGFITQPAAIKRIPDHLRKREKVARPPPQAPQPVASPV